MDRAVILQRLDDERRRLEYHGTVLDVVPPVTRLRATDGSHYAIVHAALDAGNADDIIAREVAHHREISRPFEWKLYAHDTPGDMMDRLVRHGFAIGAHEAVLVLDLSAPPAWLNEPSPWVRRADDAAGVADYRSVAEAALGKDYTFTATQLLEAIREGSTQHRAFVTYAATAEPVSIGRLYTHPDSAFGGLYGGTTLPDQRGKGYYRANVAARGRAAIALGARYLIIDALPTSRPIVERLGFQHLTDTWPCEWTP